MTRTALLLPLALLGLSGNAFAGVDDMVAPMLDTAADEVGMDDMQARTVTTQSRSRGNKTQTRQTATGSGGNKQLSRTTTTNGRKTQTQVQGRARSQSSQSSYGSNGDRHHTRTTDVKLRERTHTTNGTKSVTQHRGANLERTRSQGVQNGEHYRNTTKTGNVRTQDRAVNGNTGR